MTLAHSSAAPSASLEKGRLRYHNYRAVHRRQFGLPPAGTILDFGCGAGGFLIAAVLDGLDAHGIEVSEGREREFLGNAGGESRFLERFTLYDGSLLPYPSDHFDGCHSWFVFEHVSAPQVSLREIVRVLKPGGTLCLWAEDARNGWDGHANAPWPPYLPRCFAAAYLDGIGMANQAEFITNAVTYISAPQIIDVLTTLGMKILYSNADPPKHVLVDGLRVTTEEQARALGARVRALGEFESPKENLTVFARKRRRQGGTAVK